MDSSQKQKRYTSLLGPNYAYAYALCPCGSNSKARFCCLVSKSKWRKERCVICPVGPKTEYTHPKCYAAAFNDCSGTISKEHVIPASVLNEIGDMGMVHIDGLPEQKPGDIRKIPIKTAATHILCSRHNSALSPLDAEIHRFTKVSKDYLDALHDIVPGSAKFTLFSGFDVERWLLKVLCGSIAARYVPYDEGMLPQHVLQQWVDILFGRQPWPSKWGMYVRVPSEPYHRMPGKITVSAFNRVSDPAQQILGTQIDFSYLQFMLFMHDPWPHVSGLSYHPSSVVLQKDGVQKYTELDWDNQAKWSEITATIEGQSQFGNSTLA